MAKPAPAKRTGKPAAKPATPSKGGAEPEKKRLVSLDAFRGLTILLMLLVNNVALDAATPLTLKHADWSGRLHLADVVFPWFLLIVGVAIPFARKPPLGRAVKKALVRAGLLVAFGCLVDSVVAREITVGLGVLQIIGLAYLCGAVIAWLPVWARLPIAAVLLWAHTQILQTYPVPGVPVGTITPDGNAINYLNRTYLAPWHLKGLLSVLPTTALVTLGTVAGDFLRWEPKKGASWLPVVQAVTLAVVGATLAYVGLRWAETGNLPLNKPLWTGSYILACGGLGLITLGVIHLITDGPVARIGRAVAYPLTVPGTNAIFAYVVPICVKILVLQTVRWPLRWPPASGAGVTLEAALKNGLFETLGRVPGGWTYTFGYITAWWLVLWGLHRKKWYLRV